MSSRVLARVHEPLGKGPEEGHRNYQRAGAPMRTG